MARVVTLPRGRLVLDEPLVVGVLNVTPDSFSDGHLADAIAWGHQLIADGADLVDIGGESTRPGAGAVSAEQELARVLPVIEALAREAIVSIDTTKAEVARAAIAAGAQLVNDVSGGRFDPDIVEVAAEAGCAFVAGHARGDTLAAVHAAPRPTVDEVEAELRERLSSLPAGLQVIADPGLGFGKGTVENLALLRAAGRLVASLGVPVMVGPSRKRFLGELTGRAARERDAATIGACLAAVAAGASLLRVHDVRGLRDALTVFEAVRAS
jgi:dihydropteroate synthase